MLLDRNITSSPDTPATKVSLPALEASTPAASNLSQTLIEPTAKPDTGLIALAMVSAHLGIAVEPGQVAHDLALQSRMANGDDIVRAARRIGLKAAASRNEPVERLHSVALPAILRLTDGSYVIATQRSGDGRLLIVAPPSRQQTAEAIADFAPRWSGEIIRMKRRFSAPGVDPSKLGLTWFLNSIWRYRRPLTHVLVASLFVQLFALATPLFFQVVIDKVLVHQATSTLTVIVVGLLAVGVFDAVLQYLRAYTLTHTTSRIDVELGARVFDHLMRLPMGYFETRPAGQTVARLRELENVRNFLTGQGLSSIIDLAFTMVFIAVLWVLSPTLTLIFLLSVPIYVGLALTIRPLLQKRIEERANASAASQQFLIETVVGAQTLKASAVEPMLRAQWEEKLADYVKSSFHTASLGSLGQTAVQYVSKVTTAAVLFFGAHAVISGDLSIGALVAFNMLMGQVLAPVLRLSQLWQDFQQTRLSISRLSDVLLAKPENNGASLSNLPPIRGDIAIKNVSFRYEPDGVEVLKGINLGVPAGAVIGVVGASGSGKSTLTKLIQRLYRPESGQVLVDGYDVSQVHPAWLRRQIGVVLQENILFNRTIHENIALANPGMSRGAVIAAARLAGADEFITRLAKGYDTVIEERGANLSGGQRQRIAIARALISNPRILILDEATSALDYESERVIQDNMKEIVRGRTVIIIAHRLSAVRHCDLIVAMDHGRIVEQGTHRELLSHASGLYARLWRLQTEGMGS